MYSFAGVVSARAFCMAARYLEHRAFPGSLQARMMIFFAPARAFFATGALSWTLYFRRLTMVNSNVEKVSCWLTLYNFLKQQPHACIPACKGVTGFQLLPSRRKKGVFVYQNIKFLTIFIS